MGGEKRRRERRRRKGEVGRANEEDGEREWGRREKMLMSQKTKRKRRKKPKKRKRKKSSASLVFWERSSNLEELFRPSNRSLSHQGEELRTGGPSLPIPVRLSPQLHLLSFALMNQWRVNLESEREREEPRNSEERAKKERNG